MSVAVRSVKADFSAVDIDARVAVTGLDGAAVSDVVSLVDDAGNTCEGRVSSVDGEGAGTVDLDLASWVSA